MSFIKLVVFLFLPSLSTLPAAEAFRRPGFLYTRNRGLCTPQFWSSRRDEWPKMVRPEATVSNVFGSMTFERYRYDLTLMEAAERNDDVENTFVRLLKESTAALLNSYARKSFPLSPWEVKTSLIQALVSQESAAHQAQLFSLANQSCN
ncbi:uncharacterized protein LOC124940392 [Impatiens glandulifera]|uniref:uncharacterized protein LOC124940392 n=1 Tax=Impatiens glandulifera TaxID=253017 RepID=UPI001FB127A5|nr:uncharacterized protein LOC124940392 [Impatiens glandulifera]